MSDAFRVESVEHLWKAYVFDVERRTVRHGDETFERDVAAHKGAVAILCVDAEGRVASIHQYRATFDRFVWEIPAGLLDVEGESPMAAAQRELREEIGVTAAQWRFLGRFMVSPGWTDQVMHVFEARELTVVGREPVGPEENNAEIVWLSPEQIRQLRDSEEALDATFTITMNRVFGDFLD